MPVHNRKLPPDATLIQHVEEGMSLEQLSARYGTTQDYVRKNLRRLGMTWSRDGIELKAPDNSNKTIVERRVSGGEYGGVAVVSVSLPRIAMHIAYLENPNGL